jgi:hypothetical protein
MLRCHRRYTGTRLTVSLGSNLPSAGKPTRNLLCRPLRDPEIQCIGRKGPHESEGELNYATAMI